MAQRVFSNEAGKIFFSAGGRIVREPYDFGKAFKNSSIYFQASLSGMFENSFTVLCFSNGHLDGTATGARFSLINSDNAHVYSEVTSASYWFQFPNISAGAQLSGAITKNMGLFVLRGDNTGYNYKVADCWKKRHYRSPNPNGVRWHKACRRILSVFASAE